VLNLQVMKKHLNDLEVLIKEKVPRVQPIEVDDMSFRQCELAGAALALIPRVWGLASKGDFFLAAIQIGHLHRIVRMAHVMDKAAIEAIEEKLVNIKEHLI
jgi:hypothetical protein